MGGMSELPDRVRRRIADVFGDEVATSGDERGDAGSATERDDGDADRWLRENRPPHHGG